MYRGSLQLLAQADAAFDGDQTYSSFANLLRGKGQPKTTNLIELVLPFLPIGLEVEAMFLFRDWRQVKDLFKFMKDKPLSLSIYMNEHARKLAADEADIQFNFLPYSSHNKLKTHDVYRVPGVPISVDNELNVAAFSYYMKPNLDYYVNVPILLLKDEPNSVFITKGAWCVPLSSCPELEGKEWIVPLYHKCLRAWRVGWDRVYSARKIEAKRVSSKPRSKSTGISKRAVHLDPSEDDIDIDSSVVTFRNKRIFVGGDPKKPKSMKVDQIRHAVSFKFPAELLVAKVLKSKSFTPSQMKIHYTDSEAFDLVYRETVAKINLTNRIDYDLIRDDISDSVLAALLMANQELFVLHLPIGQAGSAFGGWLTFRSDRMCVKYQLGAVALQRNPLYFVGSGVVAGIPCDTSSNCIYGLWLTKIVRLPAARPINNYLANQYKMLAEVSSSNVQNTPTNTWLQNPVINAVRIYAGSGYGDPYVIVNYADFVNAVAQGVTDPSQLQDNLMVWAAAKAKALINSWNWLPVDLTPNHAALAGILMLFVAYDSSQLKARSVSASEFGLRNLDACLNNTFVNYSLPCNAPYTGFLSGLINSYTGKDAKQRFAPYPTTLTPSIWRQPDIRLSATLSNYLARVTGNYNSNPWLDLIQLYFEEDFMAETRSRSYLQYELWGCTFVRGQIVNVKSHVLGPGMQIGFPKTVIGSGSVILGSNVRSPLCHVNTYIPLTTKLPIPPPPGKSDWQRFKDDLKDKYASLKGLITKNKIAVVIAKPGEGDVAELVVIQPVVPPAALIVNANVEDVIPEAQDYPLWEDLFDEREHMRVNFDDVDPPINNALPVVYAVPVLALEPVAVIPKAPELLVDVMRTIRAPVESLKIRKVVVEPPPKLNDWAGKPFKPSSSAGLLPFGLGDAKHGNQFDLFYPENGFKIKPWDQANITYRPDLYPVKDPQVQISKDAIKTLSKLCVKVAEEDFTMESLELSVNGVRGQYHILNPTGVGKLGKTNFENICAWQCLTVVYDLMGTDLMHKVIKYACIWISEINEYIIESARNEDYAMPVDLLELVWPNTAHVHREADGRFEVIGNLNQNAPMLLALPPKVPGGVYHCVIAYMKIAKVGGRCSRGMNTYVDTIPTDITLSAPELESEKEHFGSVTILPAIYPVVHFFNANTWNNLLAALLKRYKNVEDVGMPNHNVVDDREWTPELREAIRTTEEYFSEFKMILDESKAKHAALNWAAKHPNKALFERWFYLLEEWADDNQVLDGYVKSWRRGDNSIFIKREHSTAKDLSYDGNYNVKPRGICNDTSSQFTGMLLDVVEKEMYNYIRNRPFKTEFGDIELVPTVGMTQLMVGHVMSRPLPAGVVARLAFIGDDCAVCVAFETDDGKTEVQFLEIDGSRYETANNRLLTTSFWNTFAFPRSMFKLVSKAFLSAWQNWVEPRMRKLTYKTVFRRQMISIIKADLCDALGSGMRNTLASNSWRTMLYFQSAFRHSYGINGINVEKFNDYCFQLGVKMETILRKNLIEVNYCSCEFLPVNSGLKDVVYDELTIKANTDTYMLVPTLFKIAVKCQNGSAAHFAGIRKCKKEDKINYLLLKRNFALSFAEGYKNNLGALPVYKEVVSAFYRLSEGAKLSNRQLRKLRSYQLHAFDSTEVLPSSETVFEMVERYGSMAKLSCYVNYFRSITQEDLLSDGFVCKVSALGTMIWEDFHEMAPNLASQAMSSKILCGASRRGNLQLHSWFSESVSDTMWDAGFLPAERVKNINHMDSVTMPPTPTPVSFESLKNGFTALTATMISCNPPADIERPPTAVNVELAAVNNHLFLPGTYVNDCDLQTFNNDPNAATSVQMIGPNFLEMYSTYSGGNTTTAADGSQIIFSTIWEHDGNPTSGNLAASVNPFQLDGLNDGIWQFGRQYKVGGDDYVAIPITTVGNNITAFLQFAILESSDPNFNNIIGGNAGFVDNLGNSVISAPFTAANMPSFFGSSNYTETAVLPGATANAFIMRMTTTKQITFKMAITITIYLNPSLPNQVYTRSNALLMAAVPLPSRNTFKLDSVMNYAYKLWVECTASDLYNGGDIAAVSFPKGISMANIEGFGTIAGLSSVNDAYVGKFSLGAYGWGLFSGFYEPLSTKGARRWDNFVVVWINPNVPVGGDSAASTFLTKGYATVCGTTTLQEYETRPPRDMFEEFARVLRYMETVPKVMSNADHGKVINYVTNSVKTAISSPKFWGLLEKSAGVAAKGVDYLPIPGKNLVKVGVKGAGKAAGAMKNQTAKKKGKKELEEDKKKAQRLQAKIDADYLKLGYSGVT